MEGVAETHADGGRRNDFEIISVSGKDVLRGMRTDEKMETEQERIKA